ncbi:xanthan lyase [candidate division KSB1 bacterium]|nr:xanthan lyase [candidate division KSB1 bacterium]
MVTRCRWMASCGVVLVVLAILAGCAARLPRGPHYDYTDMDKPTQHVHKKMERLIQECVHTRIPIALTPNVRIDSVRVDESQQKIVIDCNKPLSFVAFRAANTAHLYDRLRELLGRKYRSYDLRIRSLQVPVEELIPNAYRPDGFPLDRSRFPLQRLERPAPLVRSLSQPWRAEKGLQDRHLALWHSHGWYYSQGEKRWEWQRPRLFLTVEDVLPMGFVLPYLAPMLEDAGAVVLLPRERDIQRNRVIVDRDGGSNAGQSFYLETLGEKEWQTGDGWGFAMGEPPYAPGENPFRQGGYRQIDADDRPNASAEWIPDIPQDGEYWVAVSYASLPSSVSDAHYAVDHLGGRTEFVVNQQIGGGTWIYLGRFAFRAGVNPDSGRVVLSNQSVHSGGLITADAVRFGGGMGEVARGGQTSGRPKYLEAARYYLQTAGMPDTLVYSFNDEKDDYKDDYQSRGEWVNYLVGAPFGPNVDRSAKGLGIPVDLSFSFHTDAGITTSDTTIGTLSIYSLMAADSQRVFPDSVSRLANRDLADLVQTQLVEDIRALHDSVWTRRYLMDGNYSEAYRPNVPSMLLELLSHQNFLDMQFALDPRFRFTASRAIYKGFLRFIAFQNGTEPVITPLPVTHFRSEWSGPASVALSWQPRLDPLEPTARPHAYLVQTRRENGGFDNGVRVESPELTIDNLPLGQVVSFRVCALNEGGKSFPSAVLSVCWMGEERPTALVIDGFDRICAPQSIERDGFSGFLLHGDAGVPDRIDLGLTGEQVDFERTSVFRVNDAPGHGASFADLETITVPGNTRDFSVDHVRALRACGYSAVSAVGEAVADSLMSLQAFSMVDLLLGEQRRTPPVKATATAGGADSFQAFPPALQKQLSDYCQAGGNLLISGAYVATDLYHNRADDHPDRVFARSVLKMNWITNHAARTGRVQSVHPIFALMEPLYYSALVGEDRYPVESPDSFTGLDGAFTVMRYAENGFSAAIAYDGDYRLVIMGFPFESITREKQRHSAMQSIVGFFDQTGKDKQSQP